NRYQTAQELRTDLERQLAALPLCYARDPSLRERARKWVRRHPRLASPVTLTALLLLLAAGVTALFFWIQYQDGQRDLKNALISKNAALEGEKAALGGEKAALEELENHQREAQRTRREFQATLASHRRRENLV